MLQLIGAVLSSSFFALLWFFVCGLGGLLVLLFSLSASLCGLTRLRTEWSLLHFRIPKEGYSACTCVICSLSTTMCDDLARATEAQDEKKNCEPTLVQQFECPVQAQLRLM